MFNDDDEERKDLSDLRNPDSDPFLAPEDVQSPRVEETATVRCLASVRGDLPHPDTDQRDGRVLTSHGFLYHYLVVSEHEPYT